MMWGNTADKRGLSSVFVTIYISLIVVSLATILFTSLQMSSSAINESIRIENERSLEKIVIPKPNGINLTQNGEVHMLVVKNIGSIAVRIRGVYVDSRFVMDPSVRSDDAYIDPNENITIPLWPRHIINWDDTMYSLWTVTTERGTKYSDYGYNIWRGSSGWGDQPRFYFGPLMINFDQFYWRVGTGPWRNGWSIPKGTPGGGETLYWRIMVMNVDNRTIILNNTSGFTLICNDPAPKNPLTWYIDEDRTNMVLAPNIPNWIHYSGKTNIGSGTTYINFLTFYGSFIEGDGTLSRFGQTVPFEAVFTTDTNIAGKVVLTANPVNIRSDGVSTSKLTAYVLDTRNLPMSRVSVNFYASDGYLLSSSAITNETGYAAVELRSTSIPTIVDVAATCQGVVGRTRVVFTQATSINVTADPLNIPKNGKSTIMVQIVDSYGAPVRQAGINVTLTVTWTGGGKPPTLDSYKLSTDSQGFAMTILTAGNRTGTAKVTASASGLTSGEVNVNVT